jgi:hypothetical protein
MTALQEIHEIPELSSVKYKELNVSIYSGIDEVPGLGTLYVTEE